MDLWAIDRWARQASPLHRARPGAKVVGMALAVTAVTLSDRPAIVAALGLGWLLVIASSGVPVHKAGLLALYAMVFAALYAFLDWEGSLAEAALTVLKAGATACSVIALAVTTPYPAIFQALRRWLPAVLVDALLLTYRSSFILLHRWDHLWAALRLRHGVSRTRPLRSAKNLGPAVGVLVLGALDHSEALYDAMLVRGYRGRLAAPQGVRPSRYDLLPLALGLSSLGVCLGGRWL